jgi:ferredoxin--NADP+ reductase
VTGTPERPLRVAIIGAGPTGFYTADHLLRSQRVVEVDLFDRLPTPYGLVRLGVAPDHQKIKFVTNAFDKVAAHPRFRFFGGVEFGKDVTLADLRNYYHQIVYCTGAQTDRRMGIPGEDLSGSHPATEFVAWYNGHPDYRDCTFDLTQDRVAVVGVGNVAVDVVRILCRTPEELATTDIADYALEALRKSRVKEVYLLGRRGPAQAAFTNPEVKETH